MASPLILLTLGVLAAASDAPAPTSENSNATTFIRRSCASTLYPDICYYSLKPYAAAVQQSPVTLAFAAANVSLAKINDATSRAATLRRSSAGRLSAALRDCVESLRTAAEQTKQSAAEILKLGSEARAGGPGLAWGASNAQTWMSAALTNEDTCLDGFDGVSPAPAAAKAFCGRVRRVKQYTSNALALLNALVHG